MAQTSPINHMAPADQPLSVQAIAERLFPAYTVDEGRVSLAGCILEDRLVLQLCYRHGPRTLEVYLNGEGKEVDGDPIVGVGSVALRPLAEPPVPLGPEFERLLASGAQLAEERLPHGQALERIAATAVWCKYVEGKLRFTIGSASLDVPFSGWTRTLIPPRVVCAATGISTFHLAATDDGRIVAAERIERCAETGRRMLASELVACSVTGRRVSPELIETCPVSGRRLLRSELAPCAQCAQRVSPAAIERKLCMACRRLRRVSKADPRMARVLHEHPALDRWRHWRIGETSRVYVLVAAGWFRRLLVVVDKESLEFKLMATGSRLVHRWDVADPTQYQYLLRQ